MPVFKCTWFFEGVQRNTGTTSSSMVGWTESWYGNFASIEAALNEMRTFANGTYLQSRMEMMPSMYRAVWTRASSVDNPRLTKTAGFATNIVGAIDKDASDPDALAAQINCAVLVDIYAPPIDATDKAHHRRFLIRGLPRSLIRGNVINESGEAYAALQAFLAVIGRNRAPAVVPNFPGRWLIRAQNPGSTSQAITLLAIGANPRSIDVTAPLGNLTRGQRVQINGVTSPRGVNRIWTVAENHNSPGPYHLVQSRFTLAGDWSENGSATVKQYSYINPTQYTIIGLRNKRIGTPFRLTRGRRRVL